MSDTHESEGSELRRSPERTRSSRLRTQLPRPGTSLKRSVGELSLIVAGVLIALAANSWWEDRKDHQRERVYLRQLLSDVSETERRLYAAIADDSSYVALVDRFLEVAAAAGPADGFRTLTSFSLFEPMTGTATALVQSGDIQLVDDDSLRFQIVAWSAAVASAQSWLQQTVAQTWRNTEQVTQRWRVHLQPSTDERRRSPARWRSAADVDAALRDPALVSAMTMQRTVNRNRLLRLIALKQPTSVLRRLLEKELGIERLE